MADFQSKKTAQEIEQVLTGAVLYNTNTKLTDEQKAQARANIGATASGEGIRIIGHFDTLAELEAAVKSPKAGDAYSVGESLPYNLYIYDFLYSVWRDYGAIRSSDIKARFAQNVTVDVSAWEEDVDVFVDYTFKARIALGEVTGNDFPIVAFAPSDAVSGNYSPICYAFDSYVEIWAKSIPATAISVPAITFIVQEGGAQGNSTKGITNASGGIATGGIGAEQIADGSMVTSKYANASVTRAKLANDALYSPMAATSTSTAYTFKESDLGKTVAPSSGASNLDIVYTMPLSVASALPQGAEIAVLYRYGKSLKIKFETNAYSAVVGDASFVDARTYSVPERFGMVALKKIDYATNGSKVYWLVTGNVEVVT